MAYGKTGQATLFNQDEMTTAGGYPLKMVRSSLQKCIRFGDELGSGFWAHEMLGTPERTYLNYLLTTLACIAVEDIGSADPATLSSIMGILVFYKDLYKEKKGKAEYTPGIGLAIIMMCRARKSRVGDNYWQYISEKKKGGWKMQIPDFAYDEHTPQGRAKGRWWRFWVRIGAVLSNKATYEEIGGKDYSEEMDEFWLAGHPGHKDEPDYEPLDPSDPYKPIVEKRWNGELQKNSDLKKVDEAPVPEEPRLTEEELQAHMSAIRETLK